MGVEVADPPRDARLLWRGDARDAPDPELVSRARSDREGAARAVFDGVRSWRMLPTAANGQLAVGAYELDSSGVYAPHGVTVLTLRGRRIEEIIHFRTPSLVESFGLPAQA